MARRPARGGTRPPGAELPPGGAGARGARPVSLGARAARPGARPVRGVLRRARRGRLAAVLRGPGAAGRVVGRRGGGGRGRLGGGTRRAGGRARARLRRPGPRVPRVEPRVPRFEADRDAGPAPRRGRADSRPARAEPPPCRAARLGRGLPGGAARLVRRPLGRDRAGRARMTPYIDSIDHLRAELSRVDLMIRWALLLAPKSGTPRSLRGLVISEPEARAALDGEELPGECWRAEAT